MGTRGIIARVDDERGWAGNYHHWDSYPSGLGKTLWELYHGCFKHDLKQMLQMLIDEHLAGWSTINGADFDLEPGWYERESFHIEKGHRPVCHCHGERHDIGRLIFPEDDFGAEWAYVFDEAKNTMIILMAVDSEGVYAMGFFGSNPERTGWREVGVVDLEEAEPDWALLEGGE